MRHPKSITLLVSVFLSSPAVLAEAQSAETAAALDELKAQRALLQQKMEEVNNRQRELLQKVAELEQQRRELELLVSRADDLDKYRGGAGPGAGGDAVNPPVVGSEQKQEVDAQAQKIPELPRTSSAVGGVLTPAGRLIVEPSVEYTQTSVNQVDLEGFAIVPALLIGKIDIQEADRRTVTGSLAARYGITNNLEVEVRVPYLSRDDTIRSRKILTGETQDSVFNKTGRGIGDVEFNTRYAFSRPSLNWPYIVGNLRVKSDTGTNPFKLTAEANATGDVQNFPELPTGSGFWSVNPSFTFIYPSDPVVFFGNLGYLWTFKANEGPLFGEVDPGDAIRFSVGLGIGFNERSSFSISYAMDVFNSTTIQNSRPQTVPGSNVTVGRLLLGYALRLPSGSPLNLAVGIGATKDAPDSDLTFSVPFNFLH